MGQHLNVYVASDITIEEARAWCACRIDEYHRLPEPGFEDAAYRKVSGRMYGPRSNDAHFEAGSTWATTVWQRLWWHAYVIDDALIANMREDLQWAFITLPKMPGPGTEWERHPIFEWLHARRGMVGWGDNDGI